MARRCQRLFSLGSWRSLLSTCFHFKFSARVCIVPVCSLLCIMQSENLEACSDKSGEVLDLEIYSMKSNTQIKVEGDGRLVHVTDEEVFEVEDLPDDGKSARILADTGRDVKCTPNNNCSLGIMQSENLEACPNKSGKVLDLEIYSMKSKTQVKVEGDGRLVPATDEEVFEVEDLPDDGKSARILADTERDVKCTPNNNCSLGIMRSENLEACSYKSGEVLGLVINSLKSNTQIKVNPHTHQVELCHFGRPNVLVRQVKAELNITCICSRYYRASELIFGATEYTIAIDIWPTGFVIAK